MFDVTTYSTQYSEKLMEEDGTTWALRKWRIRTLCEWKRSRWSSLWKSIDATIPNVVGPHNLEILLQAWMSTRPKYSHSIPSPTNTDAQIRWDYLLPVSATTSFMVNLGARDTTSRCTESRLWAANSHRQSDRIPCTCYVVIYFNRYRDHNRTRRTSAGSRVL